MLSEAIVVSLDNERLEALTRSIVAIVVVLGGGLTIVFKPDSASQIVPVVTMVIGFYFGTGAYKAGASQARADLYKVPPSSNQG